MIKIFTTLIIALCFTQVCHAQWKGIWGFGASQSTFRAKELTIDNRMIGGNVFFEYPNFGDGVGPRLEFNHFRRVSDTLSSSENIKKFANIKCMYGKTFNQGKRLQFPLFAGFGINWTGGNWHLTGWGLNAKAGTRFYVGKKWGLYGEIGWDGYIDPEVGIQYANGTTEKKSIYPSNISLNVGIIFSNF